MFLGHQVNLPMGTRGELQLEHVSVHLIEDHWPRDPFGIPFRCPTRHQGYGAPSPGLEVRKRKAAIRVG